MQPVGYYKEWNANYNISVYEKSVMTDRRKGNQMGEKIDNCRKVTMAARRRYRLLCCLQKGRGDNIKIQCCGQRATFLDVPAEPAAEVVEVVEVAAVDPEHVSIN